MIVNSEVSTVIPPCYGGPMNKTYTVHHQAFHYDPITVDVFSSRTGAHEYADAMRRCRYLRVDVFCNGVPDTLPLV